MADHGSGPRNATNIPELQEREVQDMRRIIGMVALGLGMLAAGCATTGGIPMPQADVDAVNQLVESHRAAFNARDLDALLLSIAEDAKVVSLPAFGTGRGSGDGQVSKIQYREDMAALMARGDRTLFEHARWTVEFADATHATARGQGQLGDTKGDFLYKLEKRDGRWLIVESTVKRK
jgi:ketosteroid isomerase-like protein